jgi:DNA replication protein DnaT
MAGHWIPWEVGLHQKSEVVRMAKACGVHPHEMAARCMIVWAWAQDQTVDGIIPGLTAADISRTVGIPEIGEALQAVGWLTDLTDGISFPNWERFNGRPSKQRMLSAERKRRQRAGGSV